ncbi:hypothetical protein [Bradyrhizobium sp.]|uniref:hypothetical protein n=1 Tax=Bradyrhizobium sp. TaxID=376 RepID=UPI003C54F84D
MTHDTAIFDAMRFDMTSGENVWTGQMGTRQAILRDGYRVDTVSLCYCPHEWIDDRGYVDPELVRKHPLLIAI